MNPSARVALIAALAATTAPTWASLPFYSPDYTFDSTTGTGFQYNDEVNVIGTHDVVITPDGRVIANIQYYQHNNPLDFRIAYWRGDALLPTPQVEIDRPSSHAGGINRHGWISGSTKATGSDRGKPAVWRPDGTRIDLPMLPGKPYGGAPAINDSGFVAGSYDEFDGTYAWPHPVCWTPSLEIVELANPLATTRPFGGAYRINANGIISGTVFAEWGDWHAMKWDINGTATILPQTTNTGITLTDSLTAGLLDDGTIIGTGLGPPGQIRRGVLWMPNGETIELRSPSPTGPEHAVPYGVNRDHYSAGRGHISGETFAMRWSPTGDPFVLDRLSDAPDDPNDAAYDINDFNFAIGESLSGIYHRAVLWTPDGDAIDLNSLIESGDEWTLAEAHSITNTGWIAGIGWFEPSGPANAYHRPFSILVPFAGTYGMGDANFDESIDFADLLIVAQNYGTQTSGSFDVGDFNLDGSVDFNDLLAIAQNYGTVLGQSVSSSNEIGNLDFDADWQRAQSMVPEPGVVGLLGVGLMLRRRSR